MATRVTTMAVAARSPVIPVTGGGKPLRQVDGDQGSLPQPGALPRGKTRRQQPVVDFARDRKPVERCRGKKQTRVVAESGGSAGDIAFSCGDDLVAVAIDAPYLIGMV
jgi:hypothetical protein